MSSAIPSFYLYGEPHQSVAEGFVHAEAIYDRSRPSEWTIHPHSHAELSHIFFLASGGGSMSVDGERLHFSAPCLLLVPATTVHGFDWVIETQGWVLTMATRYVLELAGHDGDLAHLFDRACALELAADDVPGTAALIQHIMRELAWSAPGHRAAVNSAMLGLLVMALRCRGATAARNSIPGVHASTVARMRERVEQRFRLREPVSEHARALGLSETALRLACAKVARLSPMQMLDERAVLEARRALLYSNLSIAEVGASIGIADPAYFSRFFRRKTGLSPQHFRAIHTRTR